MDKALLCVSFGTAVPTARRSITELEEAFRETVPERIFLRAFTSPTVRTLLARRGELVLSPGQALEELEKRGISQVFVQPTHILRGREYDGLAVELSVWKDRFEVLTLGDPLLSSPDALRELAGVLGEEYPSQEREALVLFGHGSRTEANKAYAELQTAFQCMGREDVLVGTVENRPGYEEIAAQLGSMSVERVRLLPLMLTAGRAAEPVIGPEDSWRTRLEQAGYSVICHVEGLGCSPGVRAMYCRQLCAKL